LLEKFSISKVEELGEVSHKRMILQIDLEEKNQIPSGYDISKYESKGFYTEKIIQDYPIRGKAVYLCIKRRRWRHKENKNEVIHSDYSLFEDGSKLTQELSDFLKGTGRDPSIYH
jgi:transposase